MKVTEQDVIYVADQANLELTEAERGRFNEAAARELSNT